MCPWGCHEDATRKMLPWNLGFTYHAFFRSSCFSSSSFLTLSTSTFNSIFWIPHKLKYTIKAIDHSHHCENATWSVSPNRKCLLGTQNQLKSIQANMKNISWSHSFTVHHQTPDAAFIITLWVMTHLKMPDMPVFQQKSHRLDKLPHLLHNILYTAILQVNLLANSPNWELENYVRANLTAHLPLLITTSEFRLKYF